MTNRKNDIIQEAIKKAKKESVMGKLGDSPYEDPMEPWSGKYQSPVKEEFIVEVNTMLLFRYIKAQGYNPEFMTFAQRSSYARSNAFKRWKEEHKADQLATKEEFENLDEAEVEEMAGANMDTRAVHQHLKKIGWKLTRSSGGHDIFTHPESDKSIPVPRHKQLKAPLVLSIMKTSKIAAKELDEAGTGLLMSYIKAKGLNPLSMDGNQKSAYSRSSEFQQYKSRRATESLGELKELYGMKGLSDLIINQQELSELSGMGERGDDWNEEAKMNGSSDITHIVAKKDLQKHKDWMDSEGFDTKTKPLPKSHSKYSTHVGIVSKNNNEAGYHEDGFARPIKESVESIDEISTAQMGHAGKTTLKHIKNPGVGLRMAAHDIKPGIKGYRDRVDLMKAADAEGKLKEETDKKDTVTLDIPLMIRVLEYAREDAKTDMDLHKVVENLINLRGEGPLSMEHYDAIVNIKGTVKESSELDEASYGIGGYTRGFERSKQRFKSAELGKELGHEDGTRTPVTPVEEPHAVHINGKKWKTFGSKSHATNVAKSLANKVSGVTVVKEEKLTEFKKQPDNMDADDHITREGIYGIEDSPMSATNSVKAMENSGCKKEMSKSAKMIKSIYKKKGVSESTYDWEKENKGTNGKEVTAKITLTGGKTMTGKDRDTVEIEPVMKTKSKNTAGMKTGD